MWTEMMNTGAGKTSFTESSYFYGNNMPASPDGI